ncbi:MAG TPA: glycosyltransferase family 4 protein [Terriglobales bacterium]|nr:glycosyltransferase family 4 protein [Terriglobales bacterium]
MKICFISHSARLGGAEMVLLETIEVLQESGVHCFAVLPSRGPLLAELEKRHVPVLVTSYALWLSPHKLSPAQLVRRLLNMLAKSLLIARRARRWGCDIIYSNTAAICVGALAAALLGRPHLWHLHEFGPRMGLEFILGDKRSHGLMNRLSSLVIAPSEAVASDVRSWLRQTPVRVVYCSLHHALRGDGRVAGRNGRFRCLISGAIAENKRQEDAVLALLELRRRQVEAELLVIGEGDGEYGKQLHLLVTQNHLQDCVRFLGQLDDPMPQLRAADVVLVCSRAEGFGRAAAEAMLAGKPVVGADNTATAELIRDGCNGLLYRTADPQDLAGKIDCLYRHPDMAARLGQNGQAWANRVFTRERYCEQLLPLLTGLLPPAAWRIQL